MAIVASILAIMGFIAALFGFGLVHAPMRGVDRLCFYFLLFLAVIIFAVDILQHQQLEWLPLTNPILEMITPLPV
jgi:Mg2+ and Co2+ transporter CorA